MVEINSGETSGGGGEGGGKKNVEGTWREMNLDRRK